MLVVPEKPERLWLDASTGTLQWQALPSCKGEILGYQVPGEWDAGSRERGVCGEIRTLLSPSGPGRSRVLVPISSCPSCS